MPKITDPDWLEAQYNARRAIPDHLEILAEWERRSERARSRLPCSLDLAYGEGPREKLDLFRAGAATGPVHVFIHGGYWQRGDKRVHSFLGESMCVRGIHVAIVGYDLCPAVGIDEIVTQIRKSLAWIWRNSGDLGIDARRIQVSGHSAGGHLTAMLMATDWPTLGADLPPDLVHSAIGISGIFELEPLIQTSINDAVGMDLSIAKRNSPALLKPATRAPMTVAVGGRESEEFHRQARELAAAWRKHDVPVSVLEIPDTNHFTVLEDLAGGGLLFERAMDLLNQATGDTSRVVSPTA
ncbi:MAG: alpha/beta hydrolase [Gammaproteobacteria bacterium]|nr:alpha/beta hydrolase [Gammaproteobacteria bacterium]